MTVFSVTEMADFKDCRRRHHNGSLNGLAREPWLPAKPLILGTLIHATLADWSVAWHHGDRNLGFPVAAFNKHWDAAETAIRQRYSQKYLVQLGEGNDIPEPSPITEVTMSDQEMDTLYGESVRDLGRAMIANYADYYGEPYPSSSYELVEVEQTITVPILGTEHCRCCAEVDPESWQGHTMPLGSCNCRKCVHNPDVTVHRRQDICGRSGDCFCMEPHFLEGTFDMLLADKRGRLLIPDHKSYERRPSEMENAQNDQFLRYQWIVSQALPDRECVGSLYNGLWKRTEIPRDAKGNPKKNSRGYPYTQDDLFFRDIIPHDREEVEEIGYYLPQEVLEMERARHNPAMRWPHRSWSTCPNCGLQDLCVAMSRGEDTSEFDRDFTARQKTPAWLGRD